MYYVFVNMLKKNNSETKTFQLDFYLYFVSVKHECPELFTYSHLLFCPP